MNASAKVGKRMRWQTMSSSCSWSTVDGLAGRRLAASCSVGLARSFDPWGSTGRRLSADRTVAASLHDSVSVVAQESAAQGGVGDGEMFVGTDERASQGRCLELGHGVTNDAGAGFAARSRW